MKLKPFILITACLISAACNGKKTTEKAKMTENAAESSISTDKANAETKANEEKEEEYFGDLQHYDLKGHVKWCAVKSEEGVATEQFFSENGIILSKDKKPMANSGIDADGLAYEIERDGMTGRIVSKSIENSEEGLTWNLTYKYDNKGRIAEKNCTTDGLEETTVYFYDAKGYITKTMVDEKEDNGEGDMVVVSTLVTKYEYMTFDDHGNWTKCKCSWDRDSESFSAINTREIKYYK